MDPQKLSRSMRARSLILVAALALTGACANNGPDTETKAKPGGNDSGLTDEIVIGGSASASWLPIHLAIEKGYFAEEGLTNVSFTTVASAPAASAALSSGDVQFAALAVERAILSTIAGKTMQCVMSIQDTPPTTLVVKPDGPSAGDWQSLVGKTIGVSQGGWSEIMPRYLLAKNGVDVSKVKFTSTPDATTMLTALKRGAIDAFSGIEPAQRSAVATGVGKVFFDLEDPKNLSEWPTPFVATCLQASAEYVSTHEAVVQAIRRAIVRAYDDVHADQSSAIAVAKKLQPEGDAEVQADSVRHLANTWSKDGSISSAAIDNLQSMLTEYKVLPEALPYKDVVAP